ncbi:MAG: hypothetical protein AB7G87_00490 [Clostridia bacterium]
MNFIQHFPGTLSLTASLLVCIISLQQPVGFNILCLRVSAFLIIFYAIGIMVKKVLLDAIFHISNEKGKEIQMQRELKQMQSESQQDEEIFTPLKVNKLDSQDVKVIANAIKTASSENE